MDEIPVNNQKPFPLMSLILSSCVGLIMLSCSHAAHSSTSFAQPETAQINAAEPTTGEKLSQSSGNAPAAPTSTAQIADVRNGAKKLPLRTGMSYDEARPLILNAGWKPNLEGRKNLRDSRVKRIFDSGHPEIEDCSGTGEAPCRYSFINAQGEILRVSTNTAPDTGNRLRSWWIEQLRTAQSSAAPDTIGEGRYGDGLDSGELGLEVQGSRYRHTSEEGASEWRSLSELKSVEYGIVLDPQQHYWCLSEHSPKNQRATCTKYGWTLVKAAKPRNYPGVDRGATASVPPSAAAATREPAEFDFMLRNARSPRDEVRKKNPQVVRVGSHPCGAYAVARVTVMPDVDTQGDLIPDKVVEVDAQNKTLRRWAKPVDANVLAIAGDRILVNAGSNKQYWIAPSGQFQLQPNPITPAKPIIDGRVKNHPEFEKSGYAFLSRFSDLKSRRVRRIIYEASCT
jgi:hypothetical protein